MDNILDSINLSVHVLSVRLLMVFTILYFIVPEIFEYWLLYCFYENTWKYADFTKTPSKIYVPAYWHLLEEHRQASENCICTVNWVSESSFIWLLADLSCSDMTVKLLSFSTAAYWKGFHTHDWVDETW